MYRVRCRSLRSFAYLTALLLGMLLASCGSETPVAPAARFTQGAERYLVKGSDMGRNYQNLRISRDGEAVNDLTVAVNKVMIPFSTVGYPGYHGELGRALPEEARLELLVKTPAGPITANDTVPERPAMTAPLNGTVDVSQPLRVIWTSDTDPDRFSVSATWSCGPVCGTGARFHADGDARSLIIPGGELPAGSPVQLRVYAYNDGTETFSGPFAEGSKMSIRHGDEVGAVLTTVPGPVCSDPVAFEDARLETAVRELLGGAGPVRLAELEGLRSLRARSLGIESLVGLECAANLAYADLRDNRISDLSPLSGLTEMTRLNLIDNAVSDLSPLAGLTELLNLHLSRNSFNDISQLENLKQLVLFTITGADVTDLSVMANFTELRTFYAQENGFNSLEPLQGLDNLVSLRIRGNEVSDLEPLRGKPNLKVVDLALNAVTDAGALGSLSALETLFLMGNPLTPSGADGLYSAVNLRYLNLSGTGLTNIDFVRPLARLERLIVHNNNLTDLGPVADLSHLEMLHFQVNAVTDLSPVAGLGELKYLYALRNRIDDLSPLAGLTELERVTLGYNYIVSLSPLRGKPLSTLSAQRNCLDLAGDDRADVAAFVADLGAEFVYEPQRPASQCE